MKDPIRNIKLDIHCNKIDFTNKDCGQDHYCTFCQKTVVDFRFKSKQDLEKEILKADSYVCGIFSRQQISSKTRMPRFITGILVALGLNLMFKDSNAQTTDTLNTGNTKVISGDLIVGTFEILPEYKYGGQDGLQKFIKENIVYPDSLKKSGRVIIEFTIDTTGAVRNMKVAKGFDPDADKEALRVCSLLVFTPGYRNGKSIETRFYVPIKFEIAEEKK